MTEAAWRTLATIALLGQSATFVRLAIAGLTRTYRAFLVWIAIGCLKTGSMLYVGLDSHAYKDIFICGELLVLSALVMACWEAYDLTATATASLRKLSYTYLPRFLALAGAVGFAGVALSGGSLDFSRWVWTITTMRCGIFIACAAFVLGAPLFFRGRFMPTTEPGNNNTRHRWMLLTFCAVQGGAVALTISTRSTRPWNAVVMAVAACCWCAWPWIFTSNGQSAGYTDEQKRRLRGELGYSDDV